MKKLLALALLLFSIGAHAQLATVNCAGGTPCNATTGPSGTGTGDPLWQAMGKFNNLTGSVQQTGLNIMDYGAFCDTVYTVPGGTTTITATSGSPVVVIAGSSIGNNFVGATIVIGLIGPGGLPLRSTIVSIAGTSITLADNSSLTYSGADRYAYGHDDQPAAASMIASGNRHVMLPANRTCGIRSTISLTNVRPIHFDCNETPIVALTALGGSAMIKMPATGGGFWQAINSELTDCQLDGMGVANYNIEHTASVNWTIYHMALMNAAVTNFYLHATALNNLFDNWGIYNEAYTVPFPGATGYGIDINGGSPTDNRFSNIIGGGGANPSGFASGGIRDLTFGTFWTNIHFYSVHNGPSFDFNGAVHVNSIYADMGASQPNQQGVSVTGGFNQLNNVFCYASGAYANQICLDVHSNSNNHISNVICEGFDTIANCEVGGGSTNIIDAATGGTGLGEGMLSPQIMGAFLSTITPTNHFCGPSGNTTCANGSTKVALPSPWSGKFTELYCTLLTAPGVGQNTVFTMKVNASSGTTPVTCTVTDTDTNCKDPLLNLGDQYANTGDSIGITPNQTYYIDALPSAGAAASSGYCGYKFTIHAK